ncbi:hypothetical protein OYT1_ch2622 [Ferriphaselus amnicola]|uniref:Uncharacterized protein n=1 Tax=Ferriphaselus amnicola TaxID=1188319 RepID=A0A2Z6GFU7_9PROT|nr:hypothetical protein [Ferriphaselus amnicola]BBE52134.1 hypothetical protein OYT1_ch2622 [Ferriphaselus amnicola]
MTDELELMQLMARFKLHVRRQLNQLVDLDLLKTDSAYARTRLSEIENLADDEELLMMVLRLRSILLPVAPPPKPQAVEEPPKVESGRSYKFGARSW